MWTAGYQGAAYLQTCKGLGIFGGCEQGSVHSASCWSPIFCSPTKNIKKVVLLLIFRTFNAFILDCSIRFFSPKCFLPGKTVTSFSPRSNGHFFLVGKKGRLPAVDAGNVLPASRAAHGDRDASQGDSQPAAVTPLLAEVAQRQRLLLGLSLWCSTGHQSSEGQGPKKLMIDGMLVVYA